MEVSNDIEYIVLVDSIYLSNIRQTSPHYPNPRFKAHQALTQFIIPEIIHVPLPAQISFVLVLYIHLTHFNLIASLYIEKIQCLPHYKRQNMEAQQRREQSINLSALGYSERAKYHLRSNWCFCVGFTVIYGLLVSFVVPQFVPWYLSQAVISPLGIWYQIVYLRIARGESPSFEDLKFGFNDTAILMKAIGLSIFVTIITYVGFYLLIIPGIYAGLALSQTYFIFIENPDLGIIETMKASEMMMRGRKMKLFLQAISFVGWLVLSMVSFGIGFLWLGPYFNATMAQFYIGAKNEIQRQYEKEQKQKMVRNEE